MSAKDKIEKGINYVIRFAVGLLGLTIIILMLWDLLGGGKSDKGPEIFMIIFGVFGGILFIKYALRGNKQKIPNKTKGLIIKACEEGNIHNIKMTLNPFPGVTSGLDLNFIDDCKKQTPLDCAIENNFHDIATLLRKHGGKTKKELESPSKGVSEKTKKELESLSKGVSGKKSKLPIPKWTIISVIGVAILFLMLAIFNGPNISIHQAVFDGNIEAVKQHLAAGTDVNAKDEDGKTPLDRAVFFKNKETADLLRKHGGKTSNWLNADDSIHSAASAGHIEAVKQHLAAGTDVNAKSERGATPLHRAATFGHKEIAELLIDKGADVNAVGGLLGWTPLHWAASEGRKEVAELLIVKGADVNVSSGGETPLHEAALFGHKEIVELLITAGADVNAKKDNGKTPLDLAIWRHHHETADLLRKHDGKTGEELKAEAK